MSIKHVGAAYIRSAGNLSRDVSKHIPVECQESFLLIEFIPDEISEFLETNKRLIVRYNKSVSSLKLKVICVKGVIIKINRFSELSNTYNTYLI